MAKKGQTTIIGFLLITAIALVIVASTFFFAIPLIDKTKNQDEVARMENRMIETHAAIKKVANEQTQMTVPFSIRKGILTLADNNTLIYQANMLLPISYNRLLIGNSTSEVGTLGFDEPGFLLERASVEMRLHYIILEDNGSKCYGIELKPGGQVTAGIGDHFVFFKWVGEDNSAIPGCTSAVRQIIEMSIT